MKTTNAPELEREVLVERLVTAQSTALQSQGEMLVGRCPLNLKPSHTFIVDPKGNTWRCETCDVGGSAVEWIQKSKGVSRHHAVELLRGGKIEGEPQGVRMSTVRTLPSPVESGADDARALTQVFAYYNQTLKESPAALQYLRKRGLTSSEMIDHFGLGFANRTLGLRLPMANRKAGKEIRERLTRLGILRETGHEHFNGAVIVPVLDANGLVVQAYGRKITEGLHSGLAEHLYLKADNRGVWNERAIAASREVILCQSVIDALMFWCHGHRNVTASYGLTGFTPEHLDAFRRHGVARVFTAYRNSPEGDAAAASVASQLSQAGIESRRVRFLPGLDANEHALRAESPAHTLRASLEEAHSGGFMPDTEPPRTDRALAAVTPPSGTTGEASAPAPIASRPDEKPTQGPGPEDEAPTAPPAAQASAPETPPRPPVPAGNVSDAEIVLTFGDRRYRIRGLQKNTTYNVLKVNILCSSTEPGVDSSAFHVDTLDLYSARQRGMFVSHAAAELAVKEEVIKREIGRVLLSLEERQDKITRRALEPKKTTVTLTESEREAALELVTDPNLLDRIGADFDRCGVVGEQANKLIGYVAAMSRKLDTPLGLVIQSASAAGKTSLMDAVLAFVPPEDRVKYSAMTGQSLYYLGAGEIRHKVLAIAEEEGVQEASYALKLLQSEGELTIASTGKDGSTGRLVTQEYRVEGPVMLFLTTTALQIDEELLNRCVVLTVDENRDQTRAIHKLQREQQTLQGLLSHQDARAILKVHQDAQRLLRPLLVVNPYAPCLTFLDDRTRTRRDHAKYLTLIRAVTLLHQHQREIRVVHHDGKDVEYVEVTVDDIATANRLAGVTLGRSLDELPPHTRNLLMAVEKLVGEQCKARMLERSEFHFSRRDVREFTGAGNTQLMVHLQRLVEMEYLVVHRGGRGRGFQYELVYDGKGRDGGSFLPGLIDPAALRAITTTETPSGSAPHLSGRNRPAIGPVSGGCRGADSAPERLDSRPSCDSDGDPPQEPRPGTTTNSAANVVVGGS